MEKGIRKMRIEINAARDNEHQFCESSCFHDYDTTYKCMTYH